MVGGQLHDEGGGVACKHSGLFQDDAGDDDGCHAEEIGRNCDPGGAAEDRAGDHGDEGGLGAAGDERGGHDRHAAVALIFDGPGGHNAGDAASGTDQNGDEGLAGQTETAENTVQHKGDSGHVAAGLHKGQQEEQHQHLGHKAQHCADTGHNAVQDQTADPAFLRHVQRVEQIADQYGNAGDPDAVISGIGFLKAVFFKEGGCVLKGH